MEACRDHLRRQRWPAASRTGNAACTAGWSGVARLPSLAYRCEVVVTIGDERLVSRHVPRIQRVAPLLKLVARHTQRRGQAQLSRPLLGRTHVSLRPPDFLVARNAVPVPAREGGSG